MRYRIPFTLACLLLLGGCLTPVETRRATVGRLLQVQGGRPVAEAQLTVTTLSWWEPVDAFTTRTDGDGRWKVPAKLKLNLLLPTPEGARYENRYLFESSAGEKLVLDGQTLSPDRYMKTGDGGPQLRVEVDRQARPVSVLWLPAAGVGLGGGQTFAAHFGVAMLIGDGRRNAGLRAVGEWGGTAAGGALGLVFMPGIIGPPVTFELNGRYLYKPREERAEFGPEIAVDCFSLRVGVSLLGRTSWSSFRDDGRTVVSVGWGYL